MASTRCFLCTGEISNPNINNDNENSSSSSASATAVQNSVLLCEILNVPHLGTDVKNFDGITYCSDCNRQFLNIVNVLYDLQRLEKKLKFEKYLVEEKFKENSGFFQRDRRGIGSGISNDVTANFRDEIISELASDLFQSALEKCRTKRAGDRKSVCPEAFVRLPDMTNPKPVRMSISYDKIGSTLKNSTDRSQSENMNSGNVNSAPHSQVEISSISPQESSGQPRRESTSQHCSDSNGELQLQPHSTKSTDVVNQEIPAPTTLLQPVSSASQPMNEQSESEHTKSGEVGPNDSSNVVVPEGMSDKNKTPASSSADPLLNQNNTSTEIRDSEPGQPGPSSLALQNDTVIIPDENQISDPLELEHSDSETKDELVITDAHLVETAIPWRFCDIPKYDMDGGELEVEYPSLFGGPSPSTADDDEFIADETMDFEESQSDGNNLINASASTHAVTAPETNLPNTIERERPNSTPGPSSSITKLVQNSEDNTNAPASGNRPTRVVTRARRSASVAAVSNNTKPIPKIPNQLTLRSTMNPKARLTRPPARAGTVKIASRPTKKSIATAVTNLTKVSRAQNIKNSNGLPGNIKKPSGHGRKKPGLLSQSMLPRKCDECNKIVSSSASLKIHVLSVHRKVFKYICKICGSGHQAPCHFERHMSTHSTEKNFKCHICSTTFVNSDYLSAHSKRVHGQYKPHKRPAKK